jgi:hypothetical protein
MSKIDFKKTLKHLYAPSSKDFSVVEVPDMQYLMVDGQGEPNPDITEAYQAALEVLYALAYKLKFMSKQEGKDYVVPPLEGLWWADDMTSFTVNHDKSKWCWTMMIMQPAWITEAMFAAAVEQLRAKKDLTALPLVRFDTYSEGSSAQIMHRGSFDDEAPTLARLHHEWMPAHGYTFNGKHHEIYLSDPRKVSPDRLKTVLRQPIRSLSVT